MITTFRGQHNFLSNFYSCPIVYGERTYPSVENAYQAAKCDYDDDRQAMAEMTPGDAKKAAKSVLRHPNFNNVSVMEYLLRQKFGAEIPFGQCSQMQAQLNVQLLGTKKEIIVEGNTWHDNFWGSCSCARCRNTYGANMLGALLMLVRAKL